MFTAIAKAYFALSLLQMLEGFIIVIIVTTLVLYHKTHETFSFIHRRMKGVLYLVYGPQLIETAYFRADGNSFKVSTPDNDHLLITSKELIQELMHAPVTKLSLHAVAKEILQPRYTMYGFEWQDQRGVEGTGFVRALRSLLTSHLPDFQPHLEKIFRESFDTEIRTSQLKKSSGYSEIHLYPAVKRIITKANCFIFFGDELSRNTEFTAAALIFPQVVIVASELLRITPVLLKPFIASMATRRHAAARTLYKFLEPIVEARMVMRGQSGVQVPMDCMQWIIDTSPRKDAWTARRMIGEILAVWFGSVHQLAMTTTYAIEDLCLHPEYIEPLRQEIKEKFTSGHSFCDVNRLARLDSFIKESIRHSTSDAISCRRKALVPYTFKDGSSISAGDWVCVPQQAMMHDISRYPNGRTFDGFRFVTEESQKHQFQGLNENSSSGLNLSSLTDVGVDWPVWGIGNTACPGRFYAALATKLMMICILTKWDCRMQDSTAPRTMVWRSSIVPRHDTVVLFKKIA